MKIANIKQKLVAISRKIVKLLILKLLINLKSNIEVKQ